MMIEVIDTHNTPHNIDPASVYLYSRRSPHDEFYTVKLEVDGKKYELDLPTAELRKLQRALASLSASP